MNNREVGSCYEEQACLYLRSLGYRIVMRNYITHVGEVDIIARDGDYLVFTEVKYRSSQDFGPGEFHVDKRKQGRIFRVAQQYLLLHLPAGEPPLCRFDVISIDGEGSLTHYIDAFYRRR